MTFHLKADRSFTGFLRLKKKQQESSVLILRNISWLSILKIASQFLLFSNSKRYLKISGPLPFLFSTHPSAKRAQRFSLVGVDEYKHHKDTLS